MTLFKLSVLVFMSLLAFLLVEACSSGDLSRSKAEALIVATQDFKNIASVDIVSDELRRDKMHGTISANSIDESEQTSTERRKAYYFANYPIAGIANYLGLVDAQIVRSAERDGIWSQRPLGFWQFTENYTLTEKGKNYWSDYGQPVQETVIPTARKKFVSVTGITMNGTTDATVEFSYRWNANEFGKSLDPTLSEFKNLPEELRKNLLEVKGYASSPYTAGWGNDRRGICRLKKYDDGWRVLTISFL